MNGGKRNIHEKRQTVPENRSSTANVFTKVVDIASTVRQVNEQARIAASKAEYIDHLAKKAWQEAEGLRRVAENLAATATSVATVALDVCNFRDYQEAYYSNADFKNKISLDDFLQVVSPRTRRSSQAREQDHYPTNSDKKSAFNVVRDSVLDESANHKTSLSKSPLNDFGSFPHTKDSDLFVPGEATKWKPVAQRPDSHVDPEESETDVISQWVRKQRRQSLPANIVAKSWLNKPASNGNDSSTDSCSVETNPSTQFNKEKYPFPRSQTEYKDHMAASFDNHNAVPLWEDRYVHLVDPDESSEIAVKGQSVMGTWSEKKALKQFQFKFQQRAPSSPESSPQSSVEQMMISSEPSSEGFVNVNQSLGCNPEDCRRCSPRMSDKHNDQSTDDEVDEIMQDSDKPKALRKLKDLERIEVKGQHVGVRKEDRRTVSPLLVPKEVDAYTVTANDESRRSPSSQAKKHIFSPISPRK